MTVRVGGYFLTPAESIVLDAPVVSRDEKIAASARVASVW